MMHTLSKMGILVLVVFVTSLPEMQKMIFLEFSKNYFLVGFGLYFFWMFLCVVDTAFAGWKTLEKDQTKPSEQ